nr:hypothetical protein [Tanacetum cinerariifolium]
MLFDIVNDLRGEEVFVSQEVPLKEVSAIDEVNAVSTATTTTATIDDITLAKSLREIKSAKPKEKTPTPIVSLHQPSQVKVRDKGKGKMVEPEPMKKLLKKDQLMLDEELAFKLQAEEEEDERLARGKAQQIKERNRPPTRAQQRSIMCTYLKNREGWKLKSLKNKSFANIQELFDKIIKRVNTFVDHRTELVVESLKEAKAKVTEEDGDDVTIDATPVSSKSPIVVDYKIHKEGKKRYFQIFRADARFEKIKPVDYMDNLLLHNLKTMFEHHVEDNVWKTQQGLVKVLNWKLYDSCRVHCVTLQSIPFYLLVEKMYPLTNHTLHQMFNNVKLQVDYECEMAFELLRLVKKQLKEGYVSK